MEYRHLGSSGLLVSAIGLGTNQFGGKVDSKQAAQIIHAALDAGVNFIDTADIYRNGASEEAIGAALKDRPQQALIATKVFHPVEPNGPNDKGASRQHVLNGVEASLRRLATDTIDLYQIHVWDENTPIEETMRALEDLVRAGKVRYIGASNFAAWQLTHANAVAELHDWTQFISIQPRYHMFAREMENELLPAARYLNVGVIPYSPLAGGFLTGKYKRGQGAPKGSRGGDSPYIQKLMTDENYTAMEKLEEFAKENDHTMGELAHAWLLAEPQVSSVISGAVNVEQVLANVKAGEWKLTAEEKKAVNAILSERDKE